MRDLTEWESKFLTHPFERVQEHYRVKKMRELIANYCNPLIIKNILEIGPGLNAISPNSFPSSNVTLLEPASELFKINCVNYENEKNISILENTLECYVKNNLNMEFDLIILSGVLHELEQPNAEVDLIYQSLKKDGLFIVNVPNNQSVHRLMGVCLGILRSYESLTETEIALQQSKNYSPDSLSQLVSQAGFDIISLETSFIKPHTHLQMQNWLDNGDLNHSQLDQLYELSYLFEPFGSEIFLVTKK